MTLVYKRAAGVLPDLQSTKLALNQLKNSGFPMDKVSVVAQHASQEDQPIRSHDEFARQKNLEWLKTTGNPRFNPSLRIIAILPKIL